MDKDIFRHITTCLAGRQQIVLATVISRSGSGPREAGATMMIQSNGDRMGTVGGGVLEAEVLKAAGDVFLNHHPVCLKFTLTANEAASGGMICGGRMEVLVDLLDGRDPSLRHIFEKIMATRESGRHIWLIRSIRPDGGEGSNTGLHLESTEGTSYVKTGLGVMDENNFDAGSLAFSNLTVHDLKGACRNSEASLVADGDIRYLVQPAFPPGRVIIAGAGHVAWELATLCNFIGLATIVIDDRPDFASRDRFPTAREIVIPPQSFQDCFKGMEIGGDAYVVIVTRGHEHDRTVLAQALQTDAGYIGMIGSRKKRDAIYRSLLSEGFSPEDLARVHCPVGLDIGARTPAEIAVSIAAELIAVKAEKLKT